MADMYDVLGLTCGRTDGSFGVEIEVEGLDLPRGGTKKFDTLWRVEADGSLRGDENAEYVFRKPLNIEDTKNAIAILEEQYIECGSRVDESPRAGVHIHLNIQSLTPTEFMTLIVTYYMLEDYFCHWAGPTRVGNHFCLRSTDAEDVIYRLVKACKTKGWKELKTDEIRYAAINLNAIHKYGSLEFRAMRSTKDMGAIVRWVELIDQLVKGSKKFTNPRDVVTSLSMFLDGKKFMAHVMEDYAKEFEQFEHIDVWNAMENVQPISYMVDWAKFDKPKVNPFL